MPPGLPAPGPPGPPGPAPAPEWGVASSLGEEAGLRTRGGGGSFEREDVVGGDLRFPVGVGGGEGGEGDDDADGGALEVEGRSGFAKERKAVGGLDERAVGGDAPADDVPDVDRREALACQRWPAHLIMYLWYPVAFAQIDQLIEVGVHVIESLLALIALRRLRLSGDIGIEQYAGIGRRRVHVAGRGGPLALLQPAHLQLELNLTFLQSNLL
ncbi:hypothetical protein KC349_g288 [Hortaea werneckii]|nr:hypothetical protein KC349_g288 [Hortaea werneckii]